MLWTMVSSVLRWWVWAEELLMGDELRLLVQKLRRRCKECLRAWPANMLFAAIVLAAVVLCVAAGKTAQRGERNALLYTGPGVLRSPCKYHVYPYWQDFVLEMPGKGQVTLRFASREDEYLHLGFSLFSGEQLLVRAHTHSMVTAVVAQGPGKGGTVTALLDEGYWWGMEKELLGARLGVQLLWRPRTDLAGIEEAEVVTPVGTSELHVLCVAENGALVAVEEWIEIGRKGELESERRFGCYPDYALPPKDVEGLLPAG